MMCGDEPRLPVGSSGCAGPSSDFFIGGGSDTESCESDDGSADPNFKAAASNPFRPLLRKARGWPISVQSGKTIFFSRHGESQFNVYDRIGGDSSLSPRGTAYAKAMGRYFGTLGLEDLVVWTSSLRRTVQTAEYVKARDKTEFKALNEIGSGHFDGLTYEEFAQKYPEDYEERQRNKFFYRYPDGESYLDCCKRVLPILEMIEKESRSESRSTVLIVAHQAILRCIFGYLLKTAPRSIPFIKIPQHTVMQVTWTVGEDGRSADCSVEYTRMPIDHAEQGVVASQL